MNRAMREAVAKALCEDGMRLARADEPGWYVRMLVLGDVVSVWATDI